MIKEYLLTCIIAAGLVFCLDIILKTGLLTSRKFWIFQVVILILTTFSDGFSSGKPIVIFNENFITGLKVGPVPVENYLFGFSLISLNIILFEYFLRRRNG